MARARNIKPSFFTNEKLAEIELAGRVLFQGLWCIADREGRLEDRPKRIKAELLPYDDCNVDGLLTALHQHGFILRYVAAGTRYIEVLNFKKHQSPHPKEAASIIPAPDSNVISEASNGISGTSPSDCGLLIVGCPLPSKAMSELPKKPATADVVSLPENLKTSKRKQEAVALLGFLNAKTGKHYRPTDTTLKPIVGRLRDGFTVDECRAVIARKCRDWKGDDKMEPYLRPATLFGDQKFAQYVGEVPPEDGNVAMP